jgi:hypothetical protein
MAACADDYEEYSMIVSEIAKWTKDSPDAPNVYQIEEALLESIANKDIDVYEVYEGRLRLTTAPPNHERIGELWFYVSEQGKTWVRGIDPIEIGSISTSECE